MLGIRAASELIDNIKYDNVKYNWHGKDGTISEDETRILCSLVKRKQPKTIFEFGTFEGQTTYNLYLNSRKCNSRIITLDSLENFKPSLPITKYDEKYFKSEKYKYIKDLSINSVTCLVSDSALFDISYYVNKIDFIFIDGCHSFEYCMNDSLKALAMLSNASINKQPTIVWHDYNKQCWPEVVDVLDILSKKYSICNIQGTTLAMYERSNQQKSSNQ